MPSEFSRSAFYISTVGLVLASFFTAGVLVVFLRVWPYQTIRNFYHVGKSVYKYKKIVPERLYHEAPEGSSRERIVIHEPSLMESGYYAWMGWNDELGTYMAWLYDDQGQLQHSWRVDHYDVVKEKIVNAADAPHGLAVLPDGSIIVNYDCGSAMFRLGPTGEPLWIKKGTFHHSFHQAEDGYFWTWRGEGTAYGHYNYLHKFDPQDGRTVKEISLVDDVIRQSQQAASVFGVPIDYKFQRVDENSKNTRAFDWYHPNDIEELDSEKAKAFPIFEGGDLLMSFRNNSLVAVLDSSTYELKWWRCGPWINQHDPDFTEDGMISVFNNNVGRGSSNIIKIDPNTDVLTSELEKSDIHFYTPWMGKHQYLPNGNHMIVVSQEGRIIIVSPDGKVVFEFNNTALDGEKYNATVSDGIWYPETYFTDLHQWAHAYQ